MDSRTLINNFPQLWSFLPVVFSVLSSSVLFAEVVWSKSQILHLFIHKILVCITNKRGMLKTWPCYFDSQHNEQKMSISSITHVRSSLIVFEILWLRKSRSRKDSYIAFAYYISCFFYSLTIPPLSLPCYRFVGETQSFVLLTIPYSEYD